jgi:predicted alpha/beta-fold hydrolase
LQSIVPSLFPPPRVAFTRERWDTPDGDFVDVDFAGPAGAPRLLVLFHGLEGGSGSHYARALAAAAPAAGWRLAIPHFRGCSGELNRLPRAYHSGDSGEIDWMLRRFSALNGNLSAAGISLGGNALLKWLGERGEEAAAVVRRAAAVSAPLDLTAAGPALDRGLNRLIYTRHFLHTLIPKSLAKLERHPGIFDGERVRAATSFLEFDDLVTASLHGYRDVQDYWRRASSAPLLENIRVPTLVLNARNDPFLPEAALVAATRRVSPSVTLEQPAAGGHVGFPGRGDWLARRLLAFLGA